MPDIGPYVSANCLSLRPSADPHGPSLAQSTATTVASWSRAWIRESTATPAESTLGSCGTEQDVSQATMAREEEVLTAKHAPSRARKVRKLRSVAIVLTSSKAQYWLLGQFDRKLCCLKGTRSRTSEVLSTPFKSRRSSCWTRTGNFGSCRPSRLLNLGILRKTRPICNETSSLERRRTAPCAAYSATQIAHFRGSDWLPLSALE